MFRSRFPTVLALGALLLTLSAGAAAAEVDCDSVYCFSPEDFSAGETLSGICVTELPDADTGTVLLGSRVIRPGDILTAEQLSRMTFVPLRTTADRDAVMTYLPVYAGRVDREATTAIAIHGKEDKPPVAEDFAMETYKNLPGEARLKATDPEGQALTYTLTRAPKRGDVEIRADGSFVYTPRKNKVGVDSFTYTAADPAGNVSREATVTVKILRPSDARQYSDTTDSACRFTAEWMRNTGIFSGEQVGSELCFQPEQAVSRGEFLAMVMRALDIAPEQDASYTGFTDETPAWLTPYLAAAMRSGLVSGYPQDSGPVFKAEQQITQLEAASILQRALELPVSTALTEETALPGWAAGPVEALRSEGIRLDSTDGLTRSDAAQALYRAVQVADAKNLSLKN